MSSANAFELPIRSARLDNGLRVVLHRDPSLPLVAINLWYHVGSKDESPERTGLAHLFEHMLFQGSLHVGTNEHFRLVQQVGGVANGSTWFDRTNYYETLPAHCLELGLWLEADRMGFLLPALTQEKLDTQRDVVINERHQSVDNRPYGRAMERLHELLYPVGHPYRWPVIGLPEHLRATSLADLERFFRRFYAPDNAVLTLAGDLDVERSLELVERYFGPIPAARIADSAPSTAPATGAPGRDELPDDVPLARIYLGWTVPPYGSSEWYRLNLLTTILAGGKSSPLHRDLVHDRQLAQDVTAFVFPTELCATLVVAATARPESDIAALEAAIFEHVAGLCDPERVGDGLERARNQVQTGALAELQTVGRRADLIGQLTTYFDDPERITNELERALGPSAGEIAEAAQRLLGAGRSARLRVVPRAAG